MTGHERVLLSSIDTLTFYDGEHTTFRRTGPVLQLTCKGQPCKRYKPDVIQCHNTGGSGSNVQWKCEADLPESMKLGRTEVSCEGYRSSDDPYVLEGSCGLTYTLKDSGFSSNRLASNGISLEACLFWALFAAVGIFIIYPFLRSLFSTALRPWSRYLPGWLGGSGGGGSGGGGGGSGGWGWGNRPGPRFWGGGRPSDPPPPYSPRNPPRSKPSSDNSESWRPGFWTGLAAGTAAMRLFGNQQERRRDYDFDQSPFVARPYGFGTGGLFGGRTAGIPRVTTYRGQGSSRDMNDPNDLGPLRSSTGFGGTRNR
ncbi:hypothetical protein CROQUDRAFT_664061 [Cronartium quercuum f. sp. fusiforme G11]|uniref:Store-operated calcium entry-associated regulatory factor n=1 Tax=Cronartium quercuum f. sp. fusiforme G11 TaxID=708437 RepID=A0A9P6NBL5_9BASI|nr:hypothetical protein CROQUDRAFT_664061 [Cronartium quercuum f. sp. fusiforme G11]